MSFRSAILTAPRRLSDPSLWRFQGSFQGGLGTIVAIPVGAVALLVLPHGKTVAATLIGATLFAGYIALEAPARIRALWLTATAPVAGFAAAIGALASEPGWLAVSAMAIGGVLTGYCVAISDRLYFAAQTCLLQFLVIQGLFLSESEAPAMLLLTGAGMLIQAGVAALLWAAWDRKPGRFSLAEAWRRAGSAIAANRDLGSLGVRHALRFGTALAAGVAAYHLLDMRHHGYWIPLTVLFVLRPFADQTWERIAQRAAGTVAGLVIGTALGVPIGAAVLPLAIAIAIASAVSYATLFGEYAVYTAALTVVIILVTHATGEPALEAADQRAVGTALGIAIAALAVVAWTPPSSAARA